MCKTLYTHHCFCLHWWWSSCLLIQSLPSHTVVAVEMFEKWKRLRLVLLLKPWKAFHHYINQSFKAKITSLYPLLKFLHTYPTFLLLPCMLTRFLESGKRFKNTFKKLIFFVLMKKMVFLDYFDIMILKIIF